MKLVYIESPFAGEIEANLEYARRCVVDCLSRGESGYASHLLFTQPGILDDARPAERKLGMEAGFAWGEKADLTAVYIDRGISGGMQVGIERAKAAGRPIEYRRIEK